MIIIKKEKKEEKHQQKIKKVLFLLWIIEFKKNRFIFKTTSEKIFRLKELITRLIQSPRNILNCFLDLTIKTNEIVSLLTQLISQTNDAKTEVQKIKEYLINKSLLDKYCGNTFFKNKVATVSDSIYPAITERKSNICICTLAIGKDFNNIVKKCICSIESYANKNNYDFAFLDETPNRLDRPTPWVKIPLIYSLLNKEYDYVIYIDADCMITNSNIKIESLINQNTKAVIQLCCDEGGINTGVMIIKKSTKAFLLLELIWGNDSYKYHPNWEQESLKNLMLEFPEIYESVYQYTGNYPYNCFPYERYHIHKEIPHPVNTWKPGDFLVHFSGLRGEDLKNLIHQYSK